MALILHLKNPSNPRLYLIDKVQEEEEHNHTVMFNICLLLLVILDWLVHFAHSRFLEVMRALQDAHTGYK